MEEQGRLTSDEMGSKAVGDTRKEEELGRVYRKLKGVRSQLSTQLRELEKEIEVTRYPAHEDRDGFSLDEQEHEGLREPDNDLDTVKAEESGKRHPGLNLYEVKALLDRKARLRKKFQELQEEKRHK